MVGGRETGDRNIAFFGDAVPHQTCGRLTPMTDATSSGCYYEAQAGARHHFCMDSERQ